MSFAPNYSTALLGSFPHLDGSQLYPRLAAELDIPTWPQFPRRNFRENMYVQFSLSLPAVKLDEAGQKITLDTESDLAPALEQFYTHYLADDLDYFALTPTYASGFQGLLVELALRPPAWVKGQVTGPVSFGLTVTDQRLRSILYDETLADVIVKNMAMSARWQARKLQQVCPNVILFVDEPYMASFGSAYVSLSAGQVVGMLDEVFAAIHAEGALAGVHCCGNTDWSVLLATQVDILNLDAYGYLETLALYPHELRSFLDRGGYLAWGLIPNDEEVCRATPAGLVAHLREGLQTIAGKAQARGVNLHPDDFAGRSLLLPRCGLGSTTVPIADRALDLLFQTAAFLQHES